MMRYIVLVTAVIGLVGLGMSAPQGEYTSNQERPFVARVPQDFPTIQQAVDAVAEGGTVLIGPGTYQENIKTSKSIRIIGAGQNTVNIWASDGIVIYVEAEYPLQIYLAGFRIEPPPPYRIIPFGLGISIRGAAQVIANQVSVSKIDTGFEFLGDVTALLSRVQLTSNGRGIWISGGSLVVEESIIESNGPGISVLDGSLKVMRSLLAKNSVAIEIGGGWHGGEVVELVENAIIGNTDGGLYMVLGPIPSLQEKLRAANQPEIGPAVVQMRGNEIVGNSRYGIALLECLKGELHTGFLALYMASRLINQSHIAFIEESNKIQGNSKADLCPPDYPWPPGFRK